MKITVKYLFCVLFLFVCALDSQSCSTCMDKGTIEIRETCRVCSGNRKIRENVTKVCDKCNGIGWCTYRLQGTKYGQTERAKCRKCNGRGNITEKEYLRCPECNGTGSIIKTITCPKCKGRSVSNGQNVANNSDDKANDESRQTVKTVAVEKCPLCENGYVVSENICDACTKGYFHKKKDGKYICRKCGKECKDYFTPCSCGQPDCFKCGGEYIKKEKKKCDLCGGDGIVTPLERMNYEKNDKPE